MVMSKMVTKAKRIDGSLWYYRAEADEQHEQSRTTKSNDSDIQLKAFSNGFVRKPLKKLEHTVGRVSDIELRQYLSSVPMVFKMGLDNLGDYVGHIIYKGVSKDYWYGIYYYITSEIHYVTHDYFYLSARLIEINNGEFIIKQFPTLPVSQTGTYNISTKPFYTDYPVRWE